jgi:hypothetical protein
MTLIGYTMMGEQAGPAPPIGIAAAIGSHLERTFGLRGW